MNSQSFLFDFTTDYTRIKRKIFTGFFLIKVVRKYPKLSHVHVTRMIDDNSGSGPVEYTVLKNGN